jgi:hypothetical protein
LFTWTVTSNDFDFVERIVREGDIPDDLPDERPMFVKPFNNQRKATVFGSCESGNVVWEEQMQDNRQAPQMGDFEAITKHLRNLFPGWAFLEIEIPESLGDNQRFMALAPDLPILSARARESNHRVTQRNERVELERRRNWS